MLERKIYWFLVLLAVFTVGCNKDEPITWEEQFELDKQTIVRYLQDNDLDATEHNEGFYYEIIDQGTGDVPSRTSKITVDYTVHRLPGDVELESEENIQFFLNQLYYGWQVGLPLISEGGSIKLYLPRLYTDGQDVMRFTINLKQVD